MKVFVDTQTLYNFVGIAILRDSVEVVGKAGARGIIHHVRRAIVPVIPVSGARDVPLVIHGKCAGS
jgi:hypothetical protein